VLAAAEGKMEEAQEETLDKLVGDWKIFQLRRGHRFSTDDLVTAWRAAAARPEARSMLDLGCGIGSVGLSTLYHLHDEATLTAVEVQEISIALARKTVAYNGLEDRVRLVHGDLRDRSVLDPDPQFELITGSPPYIPEWAGVTSPHPQRAGARMELRGSVVDYCAAAKRHLAPGGRFCFVMAAADPRAEEAPTAAGLHVHERYDIVFRVGREPHISTFLCGHVEEGRPERVTGRLVVRGEDGEWTAEYLAFRADVSLLPSLRQTGA
jgi:tRNA1Val (adenine37-N6)-methyltransferase